MKTTTFGKLKQFESFRFEDEKEICVKVVIRDWEHAFYIQEPHVYEHLFGWNRYLVIQPNEPVKSLGFDLRLVRKMEQIFLQTRDFRLKTTRFNMVANISAMIASSRFG